MHEITLVHQIDAAHRVVGHEGGRGKCARLHGHTYTFEVTLRGPYLDETGFVADFGAIKDLLNEWDHRTLLWDQDPLVVLVQEYAEVTTFGQTEPQFIEAELRPHEGVVRLSFNPTAENLAREVAMRLTERFPSVLKAEVACRETAKSCARWVETRAVQVWA